MKKQIIIKEKLIKTVLLSIGLSLVSIFLIEHFGKFKNFSNPYFAQIYNNGYPIYEYNSPLGIGYKSFYSNYKGELPTYSEKLKLILDAIFTSKEFWLIYLPLFALIYFCVIYFSQKFSISVQK